MIDRSQSPRITSVAGLRPGSYLGPGDEWTLFPQNVREGAAWHNVAYSSIYDGADMTLDLVGGVHLVLAGNENLRLPTPFAGQLAAGLQVNLNSGWKGAEIAALDMDTESMMIAAIIHVHTAVSVNRQFGIKGNGAIRRWDAAQNSAGHLAFTCRDATADGGHAYTPKAEADHLGYIGPVLMGNNFTGGEAYCDTLLASGSKDSSALVACGNGQLGRFGGGAAAGIDFLWAGVARAAEAELTAVARQKLLRDMYAGF